MAFSVPACPRCGYHFAGGSPSPSLSPTTPPVSTIHIGWAQQEDIHDLQDEAERLDNLIRRLQEDRVHVLRKINTTQAVTRSLPPEVLSVIFQFVCPPIDFNSLDVGSIFEEKIYERRDNQRQEDDLQLVIGAVSYQWRQIVWSTPQLWTSISIEVYEPIRESIVSILNLYFQNARDLPMAIELDMRAQSSFLWNLRAGERRSQSLSRIEPIRRAVFVDNAHKIRSLSLLSLPLEWTPSGNRDLHALLNLPTLQHLSIMNLWAPFTLCWSSITMLRLRSVPIPHCFYLLAKCPNLVEFDCYEAPKVDGGIVPEWLEPLPILNQPIVLQHLEKLCWYLYNDGKGLDFLRCFRFIKLRSLDLDGPPCDAYSIPEHIHLLFASFFSDLPPTLRSLGLSHCSPSHRLINDMLSNVPLLSELRFSRCEAEAVADVLSRIGRPVAATIVGSHTESNFDAMNSDQPQGSKMLVSLESFLVDEVVDGDPEQVIVVEMLEALFEARGNSKPFRLKLATENCWDEDVLTRIHALVRSGFRLDITLGSNHLELPDLPSMVGLV